MHARAPEILEITNGQVLPSWRWAVISGNMSHPQLKCYTSHRQSDGNVCLRWTCPVAFTAPRWGMKLRGGWDRMYTCVCMQTDTHTHTDFLNDRYAHVSFHLVLPWNMSSSMSAHLMCMHVVKHGNLVQRTHNARIGWTCLIRYFKHLIYIQLNGIDSKNTSI